MNALQTADAERVYYRFESVENDTPPHTEVSLPVLDGYNEEPLAEAKFWRRQFGATVTRKQRRADWLLGVFLPLACFYFDPIVFRETLFFDPESAKGLLGDYRSIAYAFCFVSIMTLAGFLLWGEKLKWLNGVVAGVLAASALAALAIGVVIFPFSLLGLVVFIGILGFTPLLTTVVYARNAVRATRMAAPYFDKLTLFHIAALAGMAALVIPYVFGR